MNHFTKVTVSKSQEQNLLTGTFCLFIITVSKYNSKYQQLNYVSYLLMDFPLSGALCQIQGFTSPHSLIRRIACAIKPYTTGRLTKPYPDRPVILADHSCSTGNHCQVTPNVSVSRLSTFPAPFLN